MMKQIYLMSNNYSASRTETVAERKVYWLCEKKDLALKGPDTYSAIQHQIGITIDYTLDLIGIGAFLKEIKSLKFTSVAA